LQVPGVSLDGEIDSSDGLSQTLNDGDLFGGGGTGSAAGRHLPPQMQSVPSWHLPQKGFILL